MNEKEIYVISDLHMGSGGARDNFDEGGSKERQLVSFLRHIERENGELIILGDLVDLWRFGLKSVVNRRRDLFDQLATMNVSYIPGNHDQAAALIRKDGREMHPFFKKIGEPCIRRIGDKKFMFIHGHEFDVLNRKIGPQIGRVLGHCGSVVEWAKGTQVFSSEVIGEAMLDVLERVLAPYFLLAEEVSRRFRAVQGLPWTARPSLKTSRIEKLLCRYHTRRQQDGNDVTISAHTHRPGTYQGWYYNSGSWTSANNFLRIGIDGVTNLFDWTDRGPQRNSSILCA